MAFHFLPPGLDPACRGLIRGLNMTAGSIGAMPVMLWRLKEAVDGRYTGL